MEKARKTPSALFAVVSFVIIIAVLVYLINQIGRASCRERV